MKPVTPWMLKMIHDEKLLLAPELHGLGLAPCYEQWP